MLSVSSPFPLFTSAPEVMEATVDEELAFLSTLWPAGGRVSDVPSPKGLSGVPKVTESTKTPVFIAPSRSPTLLLFDTVAPVFLLQVNVAERDVLHHRK